MTRRRFYAPPEAFTSDRVSVTLSADETQHLRKVLRLDTGNEVYVFDGAGREFRGEIQAVAREGTRVGITKEVTPSARESPLALTMAVALMKGDKFDLVVQKLTELGINRLVPIITVRADVRLRTRADALRRLDRWRRIAMEATKQCGRARLIRIEGPLALNRLIEEPPSEGELRFLFAERDGSSLEQTIGKLQKAAKAVTAVIGSEGGWADEELAQARDAGWEIVTLSGRIMRAETAAIVIAALLQHRFGDLR